MSLGNFWQRTCRSTMPSLPASRQETGRYHGRLACSPTRQHCGRPTRSAALHWAQSSRSTRMVAGKPPRRAAAPGSEQGCTMHAAAADSPSTPVGMAPRTQYIAPSSSPSRRGCNAAPKMVTLGSSPTVSRQWMAFATTCRGPRTCELTSTATSCVTSSLGLLPVARMASAQSLRRSPHSGRRAGKRRCQACRPARHGH